MRRTLFTTAALMLSLSLAACAPAGTSASGGPTGSEPANPTDSPSDSTAPTEPAAPIDTIALDAEGFAFLAAGEVVSRAPVADAAATVEALTAVLGDPDVQQFPAGECSSDTDNYRWGDALQIDDPEQDLFGDYSARIFDTELTGVSGDTITLSAIGGEQVGDDISEFIAEQDPILFEGFAEQGVMILERGWSDRAFPVGVAAFTESGTIMNIGMPIAVNSGLGC